MKRSKVLWQVGGVTFTAVLGTILHFLYGWTGCKLFAPISAINESTWEHMKLLFFPSFIFAIFQSLFFKDEQKGFWWVKLIGILIGLMAIPVLFYTYNGAIGKSPDWLNISFFFIALFFEYFIEYRLFKENNIKNINKIIPLAILSIIGILFIVFTFFAPSLPIFIPPEI